MVVEVKRMEVKKTQREIPSIAETKTVSRKSKFFDFVEEIKSEFKAINWTSREELKTYTQITVGATFIFGMMIYFADIAIQIVLGLLTHIVRAIFG